MDKESINIIADTNNNVLTNSIKNVTNLEIGGQNIITLAIAIVIASYLSDIILFILDDALLPNVYKLLDKLGNKEINVGLLKIDINKSVKHILRFSILVVLLITILMVSKFLKLIN